MQRTILNELELDFKRDHETQQEFIERRIKDIVYGIKVQCGGMGAILGLSGGVDSFVVGALLAKAGVRTTLVGMPHGVQSDADDVQACLKAIRKINPDVEYVEMNIESPTSSVVDVVTAAGKTVSDFAKGNAAARLRMVLQYLGADSQQVMGTDHATEAVIGYYTKHGDGGVDFCPIGGLLKSDIYEIAACLGAPKCVLVKAPAAGLGISKSDEDETGLNYINDIVPYLKGYKIAADKESNIINRYYKTQHKRQMPSTVVNSHLSTKKPITHVIVDCVYDFIDGSLACQQAESAVDEIIKHINEHPEQNVLYIQECHPANHMSFKEQGGIWPAHAVEDTRGSQIHNAFYNSVHKTTNSPLAHYNVFQKGKDASKEEYSGFLATNPNWGALADNCKQTVMVSGIASDYCVKETAKDFINQGFNVIIKERCLGYVDCVSHEKALNELRKLGAQVIYN